MELLQRSYPVLQILNPVHDVCSEPPEACYAAVVNTLIDGCWRRSAEGLPGGACGWQRGGLPQRRRRCPRAGLRRHRLHMKTITALQ